MRLLLDTHALLWLLESSPKLSKRAVELAIDPSSEVLVSHVSVWEIAIKVSIGRLELRRAFDDFVRDIDSARIAWLGIELTHLLRVAHLPLHHRDPFDRLLVAQCLVEGAVLLSVDNAFDLYGVDRRW